VLLAVSATPVHGQGKNPAAKEIDAATIAAYKELGADHVRWVDQPNLRARFPGRQVPGGGLPAFRFRSAPLPELPEVAGPFGVILYDPGLTDADMKRLAGMKNLAKLDLSSSRLDS